MSDSVVFDDASIAAKIMEANAKISECNAKIMDTNATIAACQHQVNKALEDIDAERRTFAADRAVFRRQLRGKDKKVAQLLVQHF